MKILMLTSNLDRPEAHLMLGLKKSGVEIKLILDKNSPFQEILEGSGIEQIYWNFKSRIDIKSIKFLRNLLKSENFDVVHTFSARALTSVLIASMFSPVKHVTYRGTTGHLSWFDPSSWLSYFNPKISKIICVSDAVKRYLLGKGIKEKKLVRIYKGHEENWYAHKSDVKKSDFKIDEKTFLVACSANMRPVKGVDLLIKALGEIPDELDIKAVLIGEVRDSNIDELLSNPKIKNRVVLTGFRKDAAAIVDFCDAFAMPSRKREGLPKALIEAMIQGKACIITNVGGMPELVTHNVHGLIVEEEDYKAIADAIVRLSQDKDLSTRLGAAAKSRILNEFTIANTVQQTLDTYKEITSN